MLSQNQIPIPHDIPLDLPAPVWFLVALLVLAFLLHLLFVNFMVGGSILTLAFEVAGIKKKDYDTLAHEIAKTVTVNKSLAVVLGVAPLLLINTLYTVYFYTANALTGLAWILIVPLVAIAFLLTYLHKYTWERLADHKLLHVSIGLSSVLIFLTIPLIFLVNINLMLYPDRWHDVHGFISALFLPNVWPRYFHFLAASLAATSLFLVFYIKRKKYPFEAIYSELTRTEALRVFYTIALIATASQFIVGPLVYVTLPAQGLSWPLILTILAGVAFAVPALYWMWKEVGGDPALRGRYAFRIATVLLLTVLFMVSGRHMFRASALAPHQEKMAEKTEEYNKQVAQAAIQAAKPQQVSAADLGKNTFKAYCIACHAHGKRLVGPPITEIQEIYKSNPQGIAAWAKAPGKKRADYPPMPAIPASDAELNAVGNFMLEMKSDL